MLTMNYIGNINFIDCGPTDGLTPNVMSTAAMCPHPTKVKISRSSCHASSSSTHKPTQNTSKLLFSYMYLSYYSDRSGHTQLAQLSSPLSRSVTHAHSPTLKLIRYMYRYKHTVQLRTRHQVNALGIIELRWCSISPWSLDPKATLTDLRHCNLYNIILYLI